MNIVRIGLPEASTISGLVSPSIRRLETLRNPTPTSRSLVYRRHASSNSSSPLSFLPSQSRTPSSRQPPSASSPLKVHQAPASASIWNAFRTSLGLQVRHTPVPGFTPAPFTIKNNPYASKKPWPPDFDHLTPRHKFHFEKTYRRRAKLKYSSQGWRRGVTIVQNTALVAVLVYFVFFLETDEKDLKNPFLGVREWIWGVIGAASGEEVKRKKANDGEK